MTGPADIGTAWPGSRALLTQPARPGALDMDAAVGQRQATFVFFVTDGVTGEHLGTITPIRQASLQHDTTRTVKRQLRFPLGRADTAFIDPVNNRISPFMDLPAAPNSDRDDGLWPLGRYVFIDEAKLITTGGNLGSETLYDEMFRVDQPMIAGLSGFGKNVITVAAELVEGLEVTLLAESAPFVSSDAWGIGTQRGQAIEALAVNGDYWSPWFDHLNRMRFRRTFDPATAPVDIDLDIGYRVYRQSIQQTSDLLTAPNVVIVVSNAALDASQETVGVATVPVTAPNSVAKRGFAIPKVFNLQITDAVQAGAAAAGLAQRIGIFETTTLVTAPDPRHDSYNVIRWQGNNWLELSWSMQLIEGGEMQHVMRRADR